jgi:hypothetical protein
MEQDASSSSLPPFRTDAYLPEGVYVCSAAEVAFCFGASSHRRRRLVLRLRRWIEWGRQIGAQRLLVDEGSRNFHRPKTSCLICHVERCSLRALA